MCKYLCMYKLSIEYMQVIPAQFQRPRMTDWVFTIRHLFRPFLVIARDSTVKKILTFWNGSHAITL